jgi:hypothetical protein
MSYIIVVSNSLLKEVLDIFLRFKDTYLLFIPILFFLTVGGSSDIHQSPMNLSSKSDRVDISRITSKARRSQGKNGDGPASNTNTNGTNGAQNGNGHLAASNGNKNIQRNVHGNGHSYSANGQYLMPENGHGIDTNGHNGSAGLNLSGINGQMKEIYDYTLEDIIR